MITGNQNPVAGKDEFYTFTDYTQMFETPDIQYNWAIWKKKTGKWVNITERPPKPGKSVSFNFGQGAIGEEFRLEVYKAKKKLLSDEWEAKKMGEIFVVPTNSKTPKISKVVLFNRGARDPNKASYQDTLIAQAHCVAMFNQEVEFNLWEDDAEGGGHNAEINKNNKAPKIYKARVNEKGIAEAKISLLSDANVLKQIANRYMMRGNPNEGANHEFYVTASYSGKIKGHSKVNVSVANPDHRPKTKPKDDTPKFPVGNSGTSGTVRQPDPEGNIHVAYFINDKGQQLSKVSVGEHVKIRILSKNMIGKRIQYVVWEYDTASHDEVYRSGVIKIIADACDTGGFTISPNIFKEGIDLGNVDSDAKKQNYFIEIISFDTSNTSKKFGVTADGLMTVEKAKSAAVVKNTSAPTSNNCGGKYCIKKGDKNELIREINIRLAGFGGNVPTDEFTDRTEKMIKQFQKDYMKVPETGKICGNVLRAIDEFQNKYNIDFNELKCKCGTCTGYGDGSNKGRYLGSAVEAYHRYEYPGIHRSLLWALRSVKFYLAKDGRYSFNKVNSGYRCRFHEEYLKKPTTNHMGKALDIHFNDKNGRTKEISDMEIIRQDIFNKYLGAKWDWKPGQTNIFNLESTAKGAVTWVHYDVREYDQQYLIDKYFVKNSVDLNGKNIIQLAQELGFKDTCNCFQGYTANNEKQNLTIVSCEDKFNKVSSIILKHEGGYVNHPSDKGGATNKGITFATWKKYAKEDVNVEPTLDNLRNITDTQATIIYRKRYWEPKGFCNIEDERVSLMIYDWTITSGGAAREVQKLLVNEFGQKITIDGGIGTKTFEAINSVKDQDELLNRIAEIRKQYYTDLTFTDGKKNNQDVFLKGWHNRVDSCLNFKP